MHAGIAYIVGWHQMPLDGKAWWGCLVPGLVQKKRKHLPTRASNIMSFLVRFAALFTLPGLALWAAGGFQEGSQNFSNLR